jgi:hypothetical protein
LIRASSKGFVSARWASVAALAHLGCSTAAPPPPAPAPAPKSADNVTVLSPARYVVTESAWIERTEAGIDRVVANGRRVELDGLELKDTAPKEPEVMGGAAAPSWTVKGDAPQRYVFWNRRDVYVASTFLGPLKKVARFPTDVERAFDWTSGVGLEVAGGALVVKPSGGAPEPLPASAVAAALAADAKRAVVISALGRILVTLDGATTFVDKTADLGLATKLEVRGSDLAIIAREGRERFLDATGNLLDVQAQRGQKRGKPPMLDPELWPSGSPVLAAVSGGFPLADGGAIAVGRDFVGRVDLATGKATSLASLASIGKDLGCTAVGVREGPMLACTGDHRAVLVDVSGAPRVERSFDLGETNLDHFVVADGDAIGYLGPCDGSEPKLLVDTVTAASPYNMSSQRSPVICVRAGRDNWIEHRLQAVDATDVIAWVPRAGGGAVALIARPGSFLIDEPRVEQRGGLRIVRVARGEPPLSLPTYQSSAGEDVARPLHVRADDTIEGWLPNGNGHLGVQAIQIDAEGRPRAFPVPSRVSQIASAGRFALAAAEDGRLFETLDYGQTWYGVAEPPSGAPSRLGTCSPVGCRFGSVVRLGWSTPTGTVERAEDPAALRTLREQRSGRPPQAPSPVVRLQCDADGPPAGAHVPESFAFGVTPTAVPRTGMFVRVGTLGAAQVPYSNGPMMALSGDIDLGWIEPLDPLAVVHRVSVPWSRTGITNAQRMYEIRLGSLLLADGTIDPIAQGYRGSDSCMASVGEIAGIMRPIGGCVDEPTFGVEALGKLLLVHPTYDQIIFSSSEAPPKKRLASKAIDKPKKEPKKKAPAPAASSSAATASSAPPVSAGLAPFDPKLPGVRELGRTYLPRGGRGFTYGAGTRDGAPVIVVVDQSGDALLAPIDGQRGTLGNAEPVGSLRNLALGTDATCSARPDDARVLLPFDGLIGLDRSRIPGVSATGAQGGLAIIRWTKDRACLDAIELAVRDERYDPDLNNWGEQAGLVRKLIARFDGGKKGGSAQAALIFVGFGAELRQRVSCRSTVKGAQ